jgi:hypothetical protein
MRELTIREGESVRITVDSAVVPEKLQPAPGPFGVCLNRGCVSQRDGKCFDDGSNFDPKRCTSRVRLCDATPAPGQESYKLVYLLDETVKAKDDQLTAANAANARLTRDLAAMTRNRDLHRQCRMDSDAEVARLRGLIDDAAKRAGEITKAGMEG